jgi:hypothetical protein
MSTMRQDAIAVADTGTIAAPTRCTRLPKSRLELTVVHSSLRGDNQGLGTTSFIVSLFPAIKVRP